jgi:hypothetical protein
MAPLSSLSPQVEFKYSGATYIVRSVDGGSAKCKLTFDDSDDSDCEEIELPVEQVLVLVKAYNRPLAPVGSRHLRDLHNPPLSLLLLLHHLDVDKRL